MTDLNKLDREVADFPETHRQGMVEIDSSITTNMDCDFGVQIAADGRVWICIDGRAFVRFKPTLRNFNAKL